jgi:hypothetical protein
MSVYYYLTVNLWKTNLEVIGEIERSSIKAHKLHKARQEKASRSSCFEETRWQDWITGFETELNYTTGNEKNTSDDDECDSLCILP